MAVTLATFMEVLDTSIANVSLPHIAGSLSAGTDESTWVLTSYLVSNAIVLPISGWISSIIGRKRFYMSCVAIFTISSLLCGLAPNLGMLIFFRILQGAGGGGLQPSEQAILADTFPPAKRGMAFAVYGLAVVLAPAIGPTLGGWITDNFTWRWIFLLNIPVGILSLVLTSRLIQDPPYLKRKKLSETKIDYIGLGLVTLGLGTLQIVLDKGQREDWFESHFIVILSVIAAASLLFLIYWEWTRKDPVIDLHLFTNRTFAACNMLMFMLGFALLGSTVLLPLFMQTLLGYTAEQSGLALLPGGFLSDAADAAGRLYALPVRSAQDDDVRAAGAFLFAVSHDQVQSRGRFPDTRLCQNAPDHGAGVSIRSDQYSGLCLSAQGEEQCGFGIDEPGAQYRRQRRHLHCDHDVGPAAAIPHEPHVEPFVGFKSAGTKHASRYVPSAAGAGLFSLGGHAQGLCAVASQFWPPGRHAGLY